MIVANGTGVHPLMNGYIRVRDSESDDELRYKELALRACAQLEGYRLALIFHEYGAQQAFGELVEACQRQDVHHVIVPSIRDLSEHPLIAANMLARLDWQAGVSVLSLGGRL
jgi:DNA invertase Pin-like site-specific DNA recombinase